MAIQKHEYELSIWNERLTDNGIEEHKQQIIGAHDMSHLGRATKVHFKKLLNGTHVVTFEMPTKFFNSELGRYVQNELLENIFNEQKIKLHFKDEWYEMVVKNVTENKNFKSIMKSITCSDGYIDELSRIGYDIQLDPELNNSVNEINDFMDVILDNSSTWQYKPEFNWGDFTEYREERFYRIPLSCFKNNTIKAYKLNLSANSNKEIVNYYTKEKRPLEMGDDLAGKEDIYWNQYSTESSCINPLYIEESGLITITGVNDYIYVPMSDFSIISPYLYKNLESAAQSTLSYYEESHKHYAIQPVSNNPKDIIQFIYLEDINNQVFHIDEANVLTDYNYTYILTIEDWENQNCIADNNVKVYYQNDEQQNAHLDRDKNSLNSFMWKPVYYDGYLDSIGQLEVSKARRVNIANRTELNLYDDTFVTVYNNKVSDTELKRLLGITTADYDNYRIVSKIDTRQILPTLARNLISNGTKITNTTGWGTRIQKVNISNSQSVANQLSELKINTYNIITRDDNNDSTPHYYLSYTNNNYNQDNNDYLINFGFIGNDKKIKKNKVYALRLITSHINNETKEYEQYFNYMSHIKSIIIGKGSINSDGNYLVTDKISFAKFNNNLIQNQQDIYILFKTDRDIENPYVCFNINKTINIESLELFEAFTRGKDILNYDNCKRPGETEPVMLYNYSGREITFTNEHEFEDENNENHIEFSSINKKDLLLESDVTIGNTYEIQNYFIQYKENLKADKSKKDTFNDKEKWYEDNDSNYSNEAYVDEDFKYENLYFNLDKCNYLNEQSAPECSCEENTLDICYYKKFGFCPYLFSPELHPRRIRTLQQSKSNRFNLIQELSKVFEVYPTFNIVHDERGKVVLNKDKQPQKYIHFITEKGNEQLTGFRYEKNLSNISRTIESQNITTKLFVDPIDSEYYDTGYCTIQTASDNIGKNSYILDFSYYTKNGLLNSIDVEKDLYGLENGDTAFLSIMDSLNGKYDMLQRRISALTNESYKTLKATNITNINGVLASLEEKQKTLQKMNRYNKNNKDNETYKKYETEYKELTAIFYGLIKDLFFTDKKYYNPYNNTLGNNKTEEWFWQNIICKNGQEQVQIWEDFVEDIINKNKYKQCGTIGQQTKIEEEVNDLRKKCNKVLKNIVSNTKDFEIKYEKYLKEGTWTDSNYLTDNEYYWGGVSVLDNSSKPQVNYNINVIDLFKADISNNDLYEIDLGDITYIEDIDFFGINNITGLPNKEKVLVSEIDFSLDLSQEDNIQVQNYTTQFEDLFQQITASVQSLTYNENVYKRAQSFTAKHYVQSDSLQGTLDQGDLTLLNANDSLKLDDNGTEGNALQNSASRYKLNGDGLFFSTDGGQSWINAVSPKGYNMNYAKIGALDTGKIRIVDSNYVYFLWDQNGISAYRTPYTEIDEDQQIKTILNNDFARFNKYGLSLVQDNKIRLRAGYEYKSNDIDAEGDITKEGEIGNNNIGFYLYNQRGQTIFKTEVDGTSQGNEELSTRMSITGEMFAEGLKQNQTDEIYNYIDLHELVYPSTYYERDSEEITDQSIISHLTQLEDRRLYVIYYQNNIEKALNTKFYYYNNHSYIKQNDKYYEIYSIINQGRYFEINHSPFDDASGNEINLSTYNYFSFNENYEGTLEHKNLYQYSNDSTGTVYMLYETRSEKTVETSNYATVYINNKDIITPNNQNINDSDYYRRLICLSKTSNSITKNLFSVLDDGTLYIGGDIIGYNNNSNFPYNQMPDKIKINNAEIKLTNEGKILMNGLDLNEEIQRRIDEIAQIVANAGIPAHSHKFSVPRQSLLSDIENGKVTSDKHIYLYPNHPESQKEVSGNQDPKDLNLKNIYIALSDEPYYKPDPHAPDTTYWSKISWVKLSDFLSSLNLQSKDWTADTQSTGVNGGGGGSVNPTPYSSSLIVDVAKQVVNAHYNYMMENNLQSDYYSNYYYITPTVNGNELKSRRDCSGLINGIWQALGDMSVQNSYWLTTYTYRTNHPRNWDLIKITTNYSIDNLQPGDVIFRESATKGFRDGHTELITEILSNNQIKTYSLGSTDGLIRSFNNNNYLDAISNYDYILRRNNNSQDMPQNSDMILIDRSIYDSTPGNDNQSAVNFYFSGQLPNTYIGPYPSSREIYESNACAGLRCIVDLCLHEYGSWRFAAASYAKLVRAYLIGGTYATSFDYNAGRKSTNLYEWMWNITHNTQSIFGDWSINNGNNHNHQTISMDFIQAIYKNLKYPDLYGASLHTGSITFKNAICRAANGIPTSNGGYWTYVSQAGRTGFIVDYGSDRDYATTPVNRDSYYGRYLMYRMANDFTIFNTYIVS